MGECRILYQRRQQNRLVAQLMTSWYIPITHSCLTVYEGSLRLFLKGSSFKRLRGQLRKGTTMLSIIHRDITSFLSTRSIPQIFRLWQKRDIIFAIIELFKRRQKKVIYKVFTGSYSILCKNNIGRKSEQFDITISSLFLELETCEQAHLIGNSV